MICSACRLARQQLAGRRTAVASFSPAIIGSSMIVMAARRGPVTALSPLAQHTAEAIYRRAVPCSYRPYSATAAAPAAPSSTTPPPIPKPDFLDDAESHIWDLLVAAFEPHELSVRDVSGGCGSMYGIEISSERFRGANTLKQQRMVNAALGDLIKGWHGVQLKTRVP
ncbi:hypothetical protein SEPCBS119000_005405 [Sporothrix epigloea]|uniref:Bola-like protein n=1 Tax=Sporothrix epigloea TaxID=1892477 RepID=A0ABP0E164_9PEZI